MHSTRKSTVALAWGWPSPARTPKTPGLHAAFTTFIRDCIRGRNGIMDASWTWKESTRRQAYKTIWLFLRQGPGGQEEHGGIAPCRRIMGRPAGTGAINEINQPQPLRPSRQVERRSNELPLRDKRYLVDSASSAGGPHPHALVICPPRWCLRVGQERACVNNGDIICTRSRRWYVTGWRR